MNRRLGAGSDASIPPDQHVRTHFVAEHRQTLDLATKIINQE